MVPKGINSKDSLTLVQNYVQNWVNEQLILHKAESNLRTEDMQFEKQLEDYRNSLIIYKYESQLISQKLDTLVKEHEIEEYYNANIKNFQLKDNIVKAVYARFYKGDPNINKIRNFFNSKTPEDRDSLEVYVENYSDLYYLDDETWILFDDLLNFVPIEAYNKELYLQNHRNIEITEEDFIYFVSFTDFKIKEGESPLSFEKENIRSIILNRRKLNIIESMREEILKNALENNDFEIYFSDN